MRYHQVPSTHVCASKIIDSDFLGRKSSIGVAFSKKGDIARPSARSIGKDTFSTKQRGKALKIFSYPKKFLFRFSRNLQQLIERNKNRRQKDLRSGRRGGCPVDGAVHLVFPRPEEREKQRAFVKEVENHGLQGAYGHDRDIECLGQRHRIGNTNAEASKIAGPCGDSDEINVLQGLIDGPQETFDDKGQLR